LIGLENNYENMKIQDHYWKFKNEGNQNIILDRDLLEIKEHQDNQRILKLRKITLENDHLNISDHFKNVLETHQFIQRLFPVDYLDDIVRSIY
jgi:hypothetical protein